ncbi:sensor histidine kinase [Paenibacillus sp. PL91]|uniref:cache domain-containing sensor histidine kinase n=1 Tax=Paenibacillus sp. PL91 TaxID=2729538 RepID=UPI00145D874A|nr:sensor histidine kinase [Paenibacillus sp. PL91]MBC9201168.1 sensor histidine kinase [Paenibacillus sp. PL91]
MNVVHTLRFKLTLIYSLSIVAPFIVLAFVLPYYFQGLLTKDTQQLTANTLAAVAENIETYFDDLERLTASPYLNDNVIQALKIKASNQYDTANDYVRLQTDRALTSTLSAFFSNTREDIISTIVIPITGQAYLNSRNHTLKLIHDYPFEEEAWYKKAEAANGKAAFINSHHQAYLISESPAQVFSVARLLKDPESGQPLGVIMSDAATSVLRKITANIHFNVSSSVAILDENNQIIYANKPLSAKIVQQMKMKPESIRDGQAEYAAVYNKIDSAGWSIVALLDKSEINEKTRWIYETGVFLSFGGLLVTFLLFLYLSRWIVEPFKRMFHVMMEVKRGNMKMRYESRGRDEIAQLGGALNSMISQINELINSQYKAVLAQRDAEYQALQAQIQPHFLYNTLNGFIALNRNGDNKKLENAIFSLSGMLRYILRDHALSTLEREFAFLSQYLELQQLRFEDDLTIFIHYDSELAGFNLPKLLLQPLVENAIIHGTEPDDKSNEVRIIARTVIGKGGQLLAIEIADNGVGFDTKPNNAKEHIGIANVRSRLQLAHPDSELIINSRIGHGTTINIYIPIKEDHFK